MKRSLVINSVGENDTFSSFIICLGDGFKALLTSRVPDLKFYLFALDENGFGFKIDSWVDKEIPIVVMWDITKVLAVNLSRMLVLPTPELPMIKSFAVMSRWDIRLDGLERRKLI